MATLADLQAEREKLRAVQAKEAFDAALAETVAADEMLADGKALYRLAMRELDGLPRRLMEAIRNEYDETRVHYLLSDAMHGFLEEIGAQGEALLRDEPARKAFKRAIKPRDLLTVSQWADRHRWLDSGTNSPGQWRTELTPYLEEIMDALSEHSPVRTVTFIKSSGVGGTEAMYNWLGYIMHHLANKDVLVVLPSLELRDREFNPRLGKMLEETRALSDLVTGAERNKANRADILEYGARAKIVKAGANSPNSLRSVHLPYVICDEVDGFLWDVGGEGDPMTLIENRQRTFSRAKTYYVSTPTIEHQSRIHVLYSRSDQRRYHVPCPHCGHLQVLEFGGKEVKHGLKWRTERVDAETGEMAAIPQVLDAWYVCIACEKRIDEGHKTQMLSKKAGARWIAARPWIKDQRGYHLNALYAPVGLGLGWKKVAQKWLSCRGDTAELKGFVNTYLGEVWTEGGDGVEMAGLITRLEDYERAALPIGIVSFGADVQKDRIEYSLVGWGEGEQAWLLDHVIIPGDTAQPHVWEDLALMLADEEIDIGVVDSGYNTSMVYAFCEGRRWAIAGKGLDGAGRPVVEDEKRRRQRLRTRRKKGAAVEPIGVDQAKAILYARLKQTEPGPGYIHFPQQPAFDDEYFAQLTAEKLQPKTRGFVTTYEWVKTRPRNEALDCLVYAFAAMRLAGKAPGEEFARRLAAKSAVASPKPAAAPAGGFAKDGWEL